MIVSCPHYISVEEKKKQTVFFFIFFFKFKYLEGNLTDLGKVGNMFKLRVLSTCFS